MKPRLTFVLKSPSFGIILKKLDIERFLCCLISLKLKTFLKYPSRNVRYIFIFYQTHSKPTKLTSSAILKILGTNRYFIVNSTIKEVPADVNTEVALLKYSITQKKISKRPSCEVEVTINVNKNRIPNEIIFVKLKSKQDGIICRPVARTITYIEKGPGNELFENIYYIKKKKYVIAYEALYEEKRKATCF